MIATHNAIRDFHRRLNDAIRDCLGYGIGIPDPPGIMDWTRMAETSDPERTISFQMTPMDGRITPRGTLKANGKPATTFPLFRDEQQAMTVWLSWCEEWHPMGKRQFRLSSAGWTFYWGSPTEDKLQLFRAEWDTHGRIAPQPHWHLDRELLAIVYPKPKKNDVPDRQNVDDLEEITSFAEQGLVETTPRAAFQTINAAKMHLGMAGWSHAPDHPECWRQIVQRPEEIIAWAVMTLKQAQQEFTNLRKGMPEVV